MLKQNCVSCGKQFTLTDKEIDFFNNRNLNLPKRCEDCRAKRNEIEIRSHKSFIVKLFEKIVTSESSLLRAQNSFGFTFKNTEELKKIGLSVPKPLELALELKKDGYDLGTKVLTEDSFLEAFKKLQ